MEILNIFDYKHNLIGTEDRAVAHKKGLWHETFHCWLIRKRGEKIFVLFQKRAATKKDYPDLLDITAAGHILCDETKEDGIRELEEELGVKASTDRMRYLGVRTETVETEKLYNKEFQHVYLLEDDTPLNKYKLQEEEVCGLIEVELYDGLKLLYNEIDSLKCVSVISENGILKEKPYVLRNSDFIERPDGYYKKIFIMAQRYFAGEKYLAI